MRRVIMRGGLLTDVRDTVLRLLPRPVQPGLRRVGSPGVDAPVLVTGNYALTVRRLLRVLQGRHAWVLVVDSDGINVWCAATGGHLSHHDVVAGIRASELEAHVEHRQLILPQLAATGVEVKPIEGATGWHCTWGPARLEDLPAYLDRGGTTAEERRMRFPLWERLEMSVVWSVPMVAIGSAVMALVAGWPSGVATGISIAAVVTALFAVLHRVPVAGPRRWATFAVAFVVQLSLAVLLVAMWASLTATMVWSMAGTLLVVTLILSLDVAGTTPIYASTFNTAWNHPHLELVDERCCGAASCVEVCPRDVLRMDAKVRKVAIERSEACILCGACVVQCPEDALRFRFDDGRVVTPDTVRRTRLNMLGRRAVVLEESKAEFSERATPGTPDRPQDDD